MNSSGNSFEKLFTSVLVWFNFGIMLTERPLLETDRLLLIPLRHTQLVNYLQADGTLEEELDLLPLKRKISFDVIEVFEKTILPTVGNPSKNYLFSTLWIAVDKKKRTMVADLCFKGEVNSSGEINIAYYTYPSFQGLGYMTEALGILCSWALQQPRVIAITAATLGSNIASQRVLLKNGFEESANENGVLQWRLSRPEKIAI